MSDSEWIKLDRMRGRVACPICGKTDWCMVSKDGTAAICPRSAGEGGWHRMTQGGPLFKLLGDGDGRVSLPRSFPKYDPPKDSGPSVDWTSAVPTMLAMTTDTHRKKMSEAIGVSAESLERLEACYNPATETWGFPIRSWSGDYVGVLIRQRDREVRSQWRKWCVKGSRLGMGLHIPLHTSLGSASDLYPPEDSGDWNELVLCITEGVTDTAAIMDYGFHTVGRTSCTAGVDVLSNIKGRIVWIWADNQIKKRRDGTYYNPEVNGAITLAERLFENNYDVRVIKPMQGKDVREWIADKKPARSTLIAVANNAPRMTAKGLR